jgi:hypothetical protein
MKKTNRNSPCPCGSGKKYKNCHGKSAGGGRSSAIQWIFLLVGGMAVAAIVFYSEQFPDTSSRARRNYTPQPGSAPPGKVWSPEHGHWHDVPGAATQSNNASQRAQPPVPQPPGPPPPGKVWSPEHGHWHDAPSPAQPPQSTTPKGP